MSPKSKAYTFCLYFVYTFFLDFSTIYCLFYSFSLIKELLLAKTNYKITKCIKKIERKFFDTKCMIKSV